MTNQVKLAYVNTPQDGSTYFEPNRTLEGRPELDLWSYWERCSRGKIPYSDVIAFRDQKNRKLVSETLKSNVEYLIKELEKIIKATDGSNPDDETVKHLFVQAFNCLSNPMLANETCTNSLKGQRDLCLDIWKSKLANRIEQDGTSRVLSRIFKTITEDTGLDVSNIQEDIFVLHKKELYTAYKTTAEENRRKIETADDLLHLASYLVTYLQRDAKSPYKGDVLEAARRVCNNAVSNTLSLQGDRKVRFNDIFQAARHLHKALDSIVFCEDMLGDNALYWLAPTKRDAWPNDSSGWLRYTLHCDAVAVRTDHASNNHGSKTFAQNVDALLTLSFEPQQKRYPRDIGSKWLLRYEDRGGERDIGESESWIPIPNSSIDVEMAATDVLKVRVKPGEEDWNWNVDIPGCTMNFWPGWGNHESAFTYESKRDIYPQDAYYGVCLLNVRLEGGPKQAFENALTKANAREPEIRAKREKEVSDADKFLKTKGNNGNE